jgi:predicted nucleic acid-binding protein
MQRLFSDTSYFLALLNPADDQHRDAVTWSRRRSVAIVVTEFVLLELGNALTRGGDRRLFLNLVRLLRNDPMTMIVPASRELFEKGRALFARRADKSWSITDCTSFSLMTEMKLQDALTTDHHFQQAGFRALLA